MSAAKYLDESSTSGRRRIAVIISDGDDTARLLDIATVKPGDGTLQLAPAEAQQQMLQRSQTETEREVQRAEVTFYSINPSGQTLRLNARTARAELGMERMSAATGGASFIPARDEDLTPIFNRIASEIRSQYLLQYYSNNQTGSRTYRRITASSPNHPELRVRAREGYYPKGN
jgi:VWFA-related protein